MKIVVTFENLEEFDAFRCGRPFPNLSKAVDPTCGIAKEWKPTLEEGWQEVPAPAPEPAPEPEKKEETPQVQYKLTDMQKAVREVLKAKGKEAAKAVLANFQDKDKPDKPAGGASALRPEDYEAAFNALKEALNG